MRKEAINTFGGGLIMDLHPLTTPSSVLTNCLNGTIITYNGNEFVLQNDMGNGEVHTAYLDKGYVPVGMKEHGGIIYVSAHNPITGKSQIGSFPSPQQLFEGEDLNVTPIRFNFSEFIEMRGSVPYIKLEYYKQKLFQVNNSDEVKIFHPGDRFVIVTDSIDSAIREAINRGAVKLRLGVINSSGSIDYIDEKNLKIYSNGLWIYENDDSTTMLDIIKSKELVQVFSAKSSGALILVIELKTFDTFNLLRKYSCNDDTKVISVEFSGETTGVFEGTTKNNPNEVGLIESGSSTVQSTIVKSGKTGKTQYKIMPACPYGVLERMAKSGTIDFDAIRANSEVLGEWRFYITETYLKIGWGYDYYNLNEDSDIEKIEFTFISITDSANAANAETLSGNYKYAISKEYYNGSFEEIIPFSDNTIQKNWIYIVRIDRYVAGIKKTVGYKLVYTGGYFNEFYEEVPDFNTGLPSGSNRSRILLEVKSEVNTSVKKYGVPSLTLKAGAATTATPITGVSMSQFVTEVPSASTDVSNYKYEVGKTGTYEVKITPSVGYEYDEKLYAGAPDEKIVDNYFGTTPSISSCDFDHSEVVPNNNSTLTASMSEPSSKISKAFSWTNNQLVGQLSTTRYIYSNTGGVASKTLSQETLEPAYKQSMDLTQKVKLFSFGEENGSLRCVLASDKNMEYNCSVTANGAAIGSGQDSGAGVDDTGLQASLSNMGNGTVGIFGGKDNDSASLWYDATRRTIGGWSCSKNEVDGGDNFLIATWKDVNGVHHPVNLASRRTESTSPSSNSVLIRVDKMIRCLLSQLLILQKGSKTINFVGPNNLDYVYHVASNTLCTINIRVPNGGTNVNVDFFLRGDTTPIETHMSRWTAAIKGLNNFLPIFSIHKNQSMSISVSIGDDLDYSKDADILNCYTNAYQAYSLISDSLEGIDRNKIYIADSSVGYSVNNDGSIAFNSYKPKSISSKTLIDWRGQTWSFDESFNDVFITSYAYEGLSGEIKDGYYNEILIKSPSTRIGIWKKGKDSDAPDLAINVLKSNKSIYT